MNLLFRTGSWWKKLALFMGIVYLQVWKNVDTPFETSLKNLIVILIGLIIGAVFTSFINNFYDIRCDSIAGKQNLFAQISIGRVYGFLTLSVFFVIIYLLGLYPSKWSIIFFLMAVFCSWLYSFRGIRFKEIPILDLIFDGLGTQFFPALFCFSILNTVGDFSMAVLGSLWLFFSQGMRALVIHQTRDKEKDMQVGLRTTVNFFSGKVLRMLKSLIIIGELISFVLYLFYVDYRLVYIVTGLFIAESLLLAVLNKGWPYTFFSLAKSNKQRILLYDIYFAIPLIALLFLVLADKQYIYLFLGHILIFHNRLISVVFSRIWR